MTRCVEQPKQELLVVNVKLSLTDVMEQDIWLLLTCHAGFWSPGGVAPPQLQRGGELGKTSARRWIPTGASRIRKVAGLTAAC